MSKEITVKEALALPGAKFIDVRAENEYTEATIPGAINIPLLRDSERVAVASVYRQKGIDDARTLGLDIVSPRLSEMVKEYQELDGKGPLVVFCWRGGMRSKSVCSLLRALGVPVYRVIGGYKAYRRYVNEYLNRALPHQVAVLYGLTGVGKTEVLQELRQTHGPAVDLEGLANNRGSVFGQVGMEPQPSQKMFEALFVKELAYWEGVGYIIVECESRRIGKIILPSSLIEGMKTGIRILTYCSLEKRIERIKKIYGCNFNENKEKLKTAIMALSQRVGKKRTADFCRMVDDGNLDEVIRYLLVKYYDPLYKYPSHPDVGYDLSVETTDTHRAAVEIREFLKYRMQTIIN